MAKPPSTSDANPPQKMSGGKPDAPKRSWKPPAANKARSLQQSGDNKSLSQKVKTARGRKLSSSLWLQRQLNDVYVQQAQSLGYRSRAAFKLIELDDKFKLIHKGQNVVDLGAAPGSWSQIALARGVKTVIGIDILDIDILAGANFLKMDFMEETANKTLRTHLQGKPHLILSDLAANTTGHRQTDHLRTLALVDMASEFALENLRTGGHFVCKVFQGGTEQDLLRKLRQKFTEIRHAKPAASRAQSPEVYLVAKNFIG